MSARLMFAAGLALVAGCATARPAPLADAGAGQRAWAAACEDFDEWDKPGPPFRIYGRTYYVGTCGISALLIVGPDGHTVIDSGTDEGAKAVLANIRALGFDPRDVKTLLTSHEHFDHVGGIVSACHEAGRAGPVDCRWSFDGGSGGVAWGSGRAGHSAQPKSNAGPDVKGTTRSRDHRPSSATWVTTPRTRGISRADPGVLGC